MAQTNIPNKSQNFKTYEVLTGKVIDKNIQYQSYIQTNNEVIKLNTLNAKCDNLEIFQVKNSQEVKYFGLEYIQFNMSLKEDYHFLVVDFFFIKFKQWGSETISLIIDRDETNFDNEKKGNPDKFCKNIQGNSTKYNFSKLVTPNSLSSISMVFKSRASIPEREWTISQLKILLYKVNQFL